MKYYIKRRTKEKSSSRHIKTQQDHYFKQLFNVTSNENNHCNDKMSVYLCCERAEVFSLIINESNW